jgi:hypothetical protein
MTAKRRASRFSAFLGGFERMARLADRLQIAGVFVAAVCPGLDVINLRGECRVTLSSAWPAHWLAC